MSGSPRLTLLAVGLATVGLVAACSQSTPSPDPTPGAAAPTPAAAVAPPSTTPLPTWEDATGGRPKGAKSPAMAVLAVREDGSACFKAWFDPRKIPDEARQKGGIVLDPDEPPPQGAAAVQCPADEVAEVLAHHAARQAEQALADAADAAVDAYLADCGHVFAAEAVGADADPALADECTWREPDQMCADDPSGCWDQLQSCLDGCGTTCSSCQATCTQTCTSCKQACGDDADCLRGCAEARAACRGGCLADRNDCQEPGCSDAEKTCTRDFEAQKAAQCPDCDAIHHCLIGMFTDSDFDMDACRQRFPDAAADCWDWCAPTP